MNNDNLILQDTEASPRYIRAKQRLLWLSQHQDLKQEQQNEFKTLWGVVGSELNKLHTGNNSSSFKQAGRAGVASVLLQFSQLRLLPLEASVQAWFWTCSYQLRTSRHLLPQLPGKGRKTGETRGPAEIQAWQHNPQFAISIQRKKKLWKIKPQAGPSIKLVWFIQNRSYNPAKRIYIRPWNEKME